MIVVNHSNLEENPPEVDRPGKTKNCPTIWPHIPTGREDGL